MKISFSKKEIGSLLISAIVLGLVFGFDDGRETFIPKEWFANYIVMASLGLICLCVLVLSQKWAAGRYSIKAEYSVWNINRYGFKDIQYLHKNAPIQKIPLGVILPAALAIFSNGAIWFVAVGMMVLSARTEHRIGKKYTAITDYEEARIAFAAPLAGIMMMAVFAFLFQNTGMEVWKNLALISIALIISNIIPFPQLSGGKMVFNSFYLYIFSLVLVVVSSFLILFIPAKPTIISAFLLAVVSVAVVYAKREI